jgi:hypothetical protein
MQHLGQPIGKQEQVQQAAEEDNPWQYRPQRVALAEQHANRIAWRKV